MSSTLPQPVSDWITYVSGIDVKVWVENPETLKESGFMGKTYVTFRVLLKASDGELVGVRHRFSEFDTLRGVLKVFITLICDAFSISNF
jgi:hypothetical protein